MPQMNSNMFRRYTCFLSFRDDSSTWFVREGAVVSRSDSNAPLLRHENVYKNHLNHDGVTSEAYSEECNRMCVIFIPLLNA